MRHADDPYRPLSAVEEEIADLCGKGYGPERIAAEKPRLKVSTVTSIIHRIAIKLPNPDSLKPLTLVQLWAAHRRWLKERDRAA